MTRPPVPLSWTERVHAWLDRHPDQRPRVSYAEVRGDMCTAKRVRVQPLWQRPGTTVGQRTVAAPCNARTNWRLDGHPRCAPHVLQGLEGRDPE